MRLFGGSGFASPLFGNGWGLIKLAHLFPRAELHEVDPFVTP